MERRIYSFGSDSRSGDVGGGDPSVLRQIRYVLFECCECREEWKHLINVNLAASQLPLARDGQGCPILNAQSFARMRNQQSVHKPSEVRGGGWHEL